MFGIVLVLCSIIAASTFDACEIRRDIVCKYYQCYMYKYNLCQYSTYATFGSTFLAHCSSSLCSNCYQKSVWKSPNGVRILRRKVIRCPDVSSIDVVDFFYSIVGAPPTKGFKMVKFRPTKGFKTVGGPPTKGFRTVKFRPTKGFKTVGAPPTKGFRTLGLPTSVYRTSSALEESVYGLAPVHIIYLVCSICAMCALDFLLKYSCKKTISLETISSSMVLFPTMRSETSINADRNVNTMVFNANSITTLNPTTEPDFPPPSYDEVNENASSFLPCNFITVGPA